MFRTGMHYLKFMLHIIETCLPLNGRLYIFRDALHLFRKKHIYLARDTGRIHETSSSILYKMHICFNMLIPELCVFTFMIIYGSLTLMYLLNCIQ